MLHHPLQQHLRLDTTHSKALEKLGIKTVHDLLTFLPTRYEDISLIKKVVSLRKGDEAVVYGKVTGLVTKKSFTRGLPISEGVIDDGTAKMKIRWFHQPYIAKMIPEGSLVKLSGVVTGDEGKLYLANPEIERTDDLPIDSHDSLFDNADGTLYAVYRETKGITSKWFRHAIKRLLTNELLQSLVDPIPDDILARYHLPSFATALVWAHMPKTEKDTISARKRFSFEEILSIQLARAKDRHDLSMTPSFGIQTTARDVDQFMNERFSFAPTNAQRQAVRTILTDLSGTHPMARLLEGDVGSGKTAVAAATMYAVIATAPKDNRYGTLQCAYMAPTELLARQQFDAFTELFNHLPITIGLITSHDCKKFPSKVHGARSAKVSKNQLKTWVKKGDVAIVVGTHSLIQKSIEFKNLAYVIIDEQHRFGTAQRQKLIRKDHTAPHLLSMSATPIPRTLALTMYGDLDISVLDEMPRGRKPVITQVVAPKDRNDVYKKVIEELNRGKQAYVICPRIDEPDPTKESALLAKSVVAEAEQLQKTVFKNFTVAWVHSKLTPKEKEDVMERFASHKIDVLVATSVVEVGVNVPNATSIIIEGAERYGLAQLHQLRGRVIRSSEQAYCYLFSESSSKKSKDRLRALSEAKNGFALAEADLALRGAGELIGIKQSGLTDRGMDALKNLKMVEAARDEARRLVEEDPTLKSVPLLKERSDELIRKLHFE